MTEIVVSRVKKELKREVQPLATFTPPWGGWARRIVCFRKLQKSSNGKAGGEGVSGATQPSNKHLWRSILAAEQPPLIWFQASHQILESGCRGLLPFSHKSTGEVQHWWWSTFQFTLKGGWTGGQRSAQASQVLPQQIGATISLWSFMGLSHWNCFHSVGRTLFLKYHSGLRFPFIGTMVPSKSRPRLRIN